MARIWKEIGDPSRHHEHMVAGARQSGAEAPVIYCVRVCGFTFEFTSPDQIPQYLAFYSRKVHPSSRESVFATTNSCHEKGYWERWWERLPLYLQEEPKRQKVVEALTKAIEQFTKNSDPHKEEVRYRKDGRLRSI